MVRATASVLVGITFLLVGGAAVAAVAVAVLPPLSGLLLWLERRPPRFPSRDERSALDLAGPPGEQAHFRLG